MEICSLALLILRTLAHLVCCPTGCLSVQFLHAQTSDVWTHFRLRSRAHGKDLTRMVAEHGSECTVPRPTAPPSQDPWAAAAAQSRMSDTTPKRGTPTPQGGAPTAPSQENETPHRSTGDPKRWTDHRKLDLDLKPEVFVVWRDRALGHLAPERRSYTYISCCYGPNAQEQRGATSTGEGGDICHVS